MRAVRDDDDFNDFDEVRPRVKPLPRQRRLAFEIALGIWLGGVALAITAAGLWLALGQLALGTLSLG